MASRAVESWPASEAETDDAYLQTLNRHFREAVERRVDQLLATLDGPLTREALHRLAEIAAEAGVRARRRKDRSGSALGRATAAALRCRARRLGHLLEPSPAP